MRKRATKSMDIQTHSTHRATTESSNCTKGVILQTGVSDGWLHLTSHSLGNSTAAECSQFLNQAVENSPCHMEERSAMLGS